MRKLLRRLLIVVMSGSLTKSVFSQAITVTPANDLTDVQNFINNDLFGGCVSSSNLTITGLPRAVGRFTNGLSSLGFNRGIVMSSGMAIYAAGPNNAPNRSAANFVDGDNDLNTQLNVFTNDAIVIEFDFIPLSDTIRFTYVWASEEYPEYVLAGYNDVFAFYLSGGPSNLPLTNIALIPGTTTAVSIDNVNQFFFSQYYINNFGGQGIQYDGYTTPLQAIAAVVPCESYHIKLVVSDVGDFIYDSAVFLKAGSFSAGESLTVDANVTSTENTILSEGCSDGFFIVSRDPNGDLSEEVEVNFTVGGTAVAGVDYVPFSTVVTIPAGQSSVSVNISALNDSDAETDETIVLSLVGAGCSCTSQPSATITIQNSNALVPTISGGGTICGSQTVTLTANSGGGGTPSFLWSPGGETTSSITVSPLVTTTYTCTIGNACGGQQVSATVTVLGGGAGFNVSANQCLQGNSFSFTNTGSSGPGLSHLWNFGDGTTSTSENATHSYLTAGNFTVTHTISSGGGCTQTSSQSVTVYPMPSVIVTTTVSQCSSPTGTATASVSGVSGTNTFAWNTTPVQTSAVATGLAAGVYQVTVTSAEGCQTLASGTISTVSSLQAIITATTQTNCGGAGTGTATANGLNGVQPYTYQWNTNPAQTTQTATGLSAGNVTVTVTDAAGCTAFETATISSSSVFPVGTTSTPPTCFGGSNGSATSFPQGGTAPYTVSWSNGQNVPNVTNLSAGVYTVQISDNGGCTGNASVTIGQPAILEANLSITSVSCFGGTDGLVTSNPSGGTPPYAYLWSNGQSASSISNLPAGNYSLVLTDSRGCNVPASAAVLEPSELSLSIGSIQDATCFGLANGSALASVSGGVAPYSYVWSNAQTVPIVNGLAAGPFSVTVTDVNGCSISSSATINQPPELTVGIASFTDVSCNSFNNGTANATASGGSLPLTYSWSNGQSGPNATGLSPGNYTVTVTDANTCSSNASVTISNNPGVSVSSVVMPVSCFGLSDGAINVSPLNGQGPFSFQWNTGDIGSTIINLSAGDYTVTVTDGNNCVGNTVITVTQPSAINILVNETIPPTCPSSTDGSATVSATGGTAPYAFQWSNGQNLQQTSNLGGGNHSVQVTDANGCLANTSIELTTPDSISVLLTPTMVSCFGFNDGSIEAVISGGNTPYQIEWNNGSAASTLENLMPGNYTLTVTDASNCQRTDSVLITEPSELNGQFQSISPISCSGINDGAATFEATGGSPPYAFVWSNFDDGPSTDGLASGDHFVTVTDSRGCSHQYNFGISEPEPFVVNVSVAQQVSCVGLSDATASASISGGNPPYTVLWSNGSQDFLATDLPDGIASVSVTDNKGCVQTGSVFIPSPVPFMVTVDAYQAAECFNSHSGAATVEISGGTEPYSIVWGNGESSDTARFLIPGLQTVAVTDALGCSYTGSFEVSSPPPVSVSFLSVNSPSCVFGTNGSIEILPSGGVPPYTANWGTAGEGVFIDSLQAGNYTVMVLDGNGCPAFADTFLNDAPFFIIQSFQTTHVSCNGLSTGSASVTVSGGTPPYAYQWSDGQTNDTAIGLSAGLYDITVTDDKGCVVLGGTTVTEPSALNLELTGENLPSCNGLFNGSLVALATGGTTPYTYFSNTIEQASAVINNLGAGFYTITVRDNNGCETQDTITIGQPQQVETTITGPDGICPGQQVQLFASGSIPGQFYTFNWVPVNSSSSEITVAPISTTTYAATAVSQNGCTGNQAVFTLNVLAVPQAAILQTTEVNCGYPASVSFAALPVGLSYLWDFGNGITSDLAELSVSFDTLGSYPISLVVSNAAGCTDTAFSALQLLKSPVANFTAGDTACGSATIPFVNLSQDADNFLWILGDGSTSSEIAPVKVYATPGNYSVKLIASNDQCTDSLELQHIVTIYPLPTAQFTFDPYDEVILFTDVSQGAISQWSWVFNDEDTLFEQNPVYSFNGFGALPVSLTVTDSNGCNHTSIQSVNVELLKNLVVPNALVYGNDDESGLFLPKGRGLSFYNCTVYDKWGNKIWESSKLENGSPAEGWNGTLHGEPVPQGAYSWKIEARFADGIVWGGVVSNKGRNLAGTVTVIR